MTENKQPKFKVGDFVYVDTYDSGEGEYIYCFGVITHVQFGGTFGDYVVKPLYNDLMDDNVSEIYLPPVPERDIKAGADELNERKDRINELIKKHCNCN